MNKKLLIALGVAGIAVLIIAGAVFAGSSLDRGNLATFPAVGTINYYAWIDKFSINGIPTEIMTEDSYNSNEPTWVPSGDWVRWGRNPADQRLAAGGGKL